MEGRLKVNGAVLAWMLAGLVWMSGCGGPGNESSRGYDGVDNGTASSGYDDGKDGTALSGYDGGEDEKSSSGGGDEREKESDDFFGYGAGFGESGRVIYNCLWGWELSSPKCVMVETEKGIYRATAAENGSMEVLVSREFVEEVLEIGVLEYPNSRILLQQGETAVMLEKGSPIMRQGLNSQVLRCGPPAGEETVCLPLEAVCRGFGYRVRAVPQKGRICLEPENPYRSRRLPESYDYRKVGRGAKVRDQGSYGTCWSFASLTALETALRPKIAREFSADHMSLHNSFSLDQEDGGEYTMSMAYLLAWQGPVPESIDPYGDGVSPDGLEPELHVQEIRILPSGDHEAIKKAVFFYGGVQSSLYTSITGSDSRSDYYKEETSSYCYRGEEVPNHDVVIVGWDDTYPRENFQEEPEGDGAFLCVSSWGEAFGDGGYFYVSYYDANIGGNSLVYTGIEPADNYDTIYQSDLCGWVGQVGYGSDTAYGANVYVSREQGFLRAAGFYAAGPDTSYEIFVVHHMEGEESLAERKPVAEGVVEYSGFYTISFEEPERLEAGERFALVLKVRTPGAVHPIAVEYHADDATASADVTDGEGYISLDGSKWEPMEERYQCNLCLKGYGTQRTNRDERAEG